MSAAPRLPGLDDFAPASALVSPCGRYRYLLTRAWAPRQPARGHVLWIMLNPSIADAEIDDPTIRRCIGFSKAWGFPSLEVVNLFAWRATDPCELRDRWRDLVGPENDDHIRSAFDRAPRLVIAAWGNHGKIRNRALAVEGLAYTAQQRLDCLGKTGSGAPRHPLYVGASNALELYRR